jgi:hypothetical protein
MNAAVLPAKAEVLERAAPMVASAWRQLADAWAAEGYDGIARLSGERAARVYAGWVEEDRRKRAGQSAA